MTLIRRSWLLFALLVLTMLHQGAEAAVSQSDDKQLEAATTNQGGGSVSSSRFRQQVNFGEPIASNRITSSRFRVIPGFLGSAFSAPTPIPTTDLDLTALTAKTEPMGVTITPQMWQEDRDPIFLWDPPTGGEDLVAGYSYAIDGTPDNTIDTTTTSFNIATSALKQFADGKHTFTVKALNSAGNSGKAVSLELWVDTAPPQIGAYAPAAGALLNIAPVVTATVSDTGSGVKEETVTMLINGSAVGTHVDATTGVVTTTGGAWKEGVNSLELRVSDVLGHAVAPLLWSVTIDTLPPTGVVLINTGAEMTTSIYVTLTLSATDATSSVARMLLSNEESSGYVEEPYVTLRELWALKTVRGLQKVYVQFEDTAGNRSTPVSDEIDVGLLAPETTIVSGPAGFTPTRSASFVFSCPEGDCVFSYAFDRGEWSDWSSEATAVNGELVFGNHYFRVKAAKDVNGTPGIQPDEEDPSPAERTWTVGVETPMFMIPKGPLIKVWRIE